MTKPDSPTKPRPIAPVRVRRHPVDWGTISDLDDITAERMVSLGPKLATGSWYLNARFTVSSPAPTPEFFKRVIELRSAWLRTCRQTLSIYGQRQEARKLRRKGQRAAFAELHMTEEDRTQSQRPPEVIPWTTLSEAERQEVLQCGRLAKNFAFSGVLFINGDLIPPRTWQAMADTIISS